MPETQALDDLTAEPHATVFADAPRTVRLTLDAGDEMPEHDHPGVDVLIVVLSGELSLGLDDETHRLEDGELVRFAGERRITPRAIADTTALVVFSPRGDDAD